MNPFKRLYKPIADLCPVRFQQYQEARTQRQELLKRINRKCRQLAMRKSFLLDCIHKAWLENDVTQFIELSKELKTISDQEKYLANLTLTEQEPEAQVHTIIVDATLLVESYKRSTELPAEGLHYLIGISVDHTYIATEIAEFEYQYREVAGAAGDHQCTHRLIMKTHHEGRVIAIQVHSHPGIGKDANNPSGTDMHTQIVWEKTTKLVQGIWSRDGYIRWFTHQLPFQVRIIGNALEQIEPNLWKISEA